MNEKVCMKQRERGRQTDRQTDSDRQRDRDRYRDRERQTDRYRDRERDRERQIAVKNETPTYSCAHRDRSGKNCYVHGYVIIQVYFCFCD